MTAFIPQYLSLDPTAYGSGSGSGSGGSSLELEAGETLISGDPVKVSANKFYKASNLTDANCVGIITTGASIGLLAAAILGGQLAVTGMVSGSIYYLGDGVVQTPAPSSGYSQVIGTAITSTLFDVSIKDSVLLS